MMVSLWNCINHGDEFYENLSGTARKFICCSYSWHLGEGALLCVHLLMPQVLEAQNFELAERCALLTQVR
jgi:hypothetical protein